MTTDDRSPQHPPSTAASRATACASSWHAPRVTSDIASSASSPTSSRPATWSS